MTDMVCDDCGSSFSSPEELERHREACLWRQWGERVYSLNAEEEPPKGEEGPQGDLGPLSIHAPIRCEYCGSPFTSQSKLAAHKGSCAMRGWWERNFGSSQAEEAPREHPQALKFEVSERIHRAEEQKPDRVGLLGRMKSWLLAKEEPREEDDFTGRLKALYRQVLAIQDPDGAVLCLKGIDLIADVDLLLNDAGQAFAASVRAKLLVAAERMLETANQIARHRAFILRFSAEALEREIREIDARIAASPDRADQYGVIRKGKAQMLIEIRDMGRIIDDLKIQLSAMVDALGHTYLRLQATFLADQADQDRRAVLEDLDTEVDALSETLQVLGLNKGQ